MKHLLSELFDLALLVAVAAFLILCTQELPL